MPRPPAARAKVVRAFAEILVTSGERTATIEAVAEHAGVSKGGLLYHFPSRDALVDGLVEHLGELMEADVATMLAAPAGPVDYLLRTSVHTGDELDLAYRALSQLAQGSAPHTGAALDAATEAWTAAVATEVGDPATARAIVLLSDGLYMRTAVGAPTPDIDELLAIVDRMAPERRVTRA